MLTLLSRPPIVLAHPLRIGALPCAQGFSATRAAYSLPARVCVIVGMALRAGSALCLLGNQACAAEYIRALRNSFKMGLANAMFHAAEVIEHEAMGYFAEGKPMREHRASSAHPEASVAIRVARSSPQPAFTGCIDVLPESRLWGSPAVDAWHRCSSRAFYHA